MALRHCMKASNFRILSHWRDFVLVSRVAWHNRVEEYLLSVRDCRFSDVINCYYLVRDLVFWVLSVEYIFRMQKLAGIDVHTVSSTKELTTWQNCVNLEHVRTHVGKVWNEGAYALVSRANWGAACFALIIARRQSDEHERSSNQSRRFTHHLRGLTEVGVSDQVIFQITSKGCPKHVFLIRWMF